MDADKYTLTMLTTCICDTLVTYCSHVHISKFFRLLATKLTIDLFEILKD